MGVFWQTHWRDLGLRGQSPKQGWRPWLGQPPRPYPTAHLQKVKIEPDDNMTGPAQGPASRRLRARWPGEGDSIRPSGDQDPTAQQWNHTPHPEIQSVRRAVDSRSRLIP
jgi:hypothetical protein